MPDVIVRHARHWIDGICEQQRSADVDLVPATPVFNRASSITTMGVACAAASCGVACGWVNVSVLADLLLSATLLQHSLLGGWPER